MTPGEVTRLAILGRLNRGPDHGYSIHQHLTETGFPCSTGRVYRVLREMNEQGYVKSWWNTDAVPPQRMYGLTLAGARYVYNSAIDFNAYVRALRATQRDLAGR